jgi:cytidylate kinase
MREKREEREEGVVREQRKEREEREENRYEYHGIESTVDPESQLLLLTHIVDSNC